MILFGLYNPRRIVPTSIHVPSRAASAPKGILPSMHFENVVLKEELHRRDQAWPYGQKPQVARVKQKRSKNTDHVIALQKGQARYQSSQKTKLQESNECDQEYESAPYNTQETHNNLNMKIEFLNHTGISSGTLSVLEGLVYVIELHVYFSMWSEAEGLSEYGVVPE
jgi:hypothetical protein